MKSGIHIRVLAIIAAVTLAFVGWKITTAGNKEAPAIGYLAPNFTLADINGKKVQLSDITGRNKVTLVNFWATWCPPCRREIPELVKLYQKYTGKKLALLAVDLQEEPGQVKAFAKENRMNFTVLTDTAGKVANQYQVNGIPTTFIVDGEGKIRDFIVGGTTLEVLEAKIKPLLN